MFGRKAFIDKWARLRKSPDGCYKTVILLAEKDGLCLVDCDDKKGFIIVNAEDIYAWDEKWINKRWKS